MICGHRLRCKAYRGAINEVNRAAHELAHVGIMCSLIPVYNLGIVDSPGGGPAPNGSEGGGVCLPGEENGGGFAG